MVLTYSTHLRSDVKWDFTVPVYRNYYAGGVINHNSGKTAFSAYKLARIARRLPDCKTTQVQGVYIVFAPARAQLQDPWGKKLLLKSEVKGDLFEKPFIPSYEIANVWYTYGAGDKTPALIQLKNGNYILFCVSGDKNIWKRIEGKGYILGVVLDESAGSDDLLTELAVRLLDANSNEQVRREAGGAWILWGATQTKKTPAFERFLALGQSNTNPDYAAFDLTPGENPAIDQAEREKLAAIMSQDAYEIRMLGHGSAAGAMALYPQWDDARNLCPVGQDYVPAVDDNLWAWYDPGSHYTGIVLVAINKNAPRTCRIVKCWQPQRSTIEGDVTLIRDWLGGRKLEGWVYDQAARKREKVGNSVVGKISETIQRKGYDIHVHRGLIMGRSEYAATVPLMRSYLHCPPGDPDYPTRLILNRSDESGCMLLRWQIQNCAFTENAYELKEENVQKGNDHLSDACRYGCSRLPAWVDRGPNPKLWGEGTNGFDPDADRRDHGDATKAEERPTIAQQRARESAGRREKLLRARRSVW